jgi:iron-sulfur cluster repair protein YtfE (RIC family)
MYATSLLEDQHRVIEALIAQLESFSGHPAAILDALANNLGAHMAIEQDTFYPAIRAVDEDLVNESYEEHALVELALKRLMMTDPSDAAFKPRVTALKELLARHVVEEEEELFPQVEEAMSEELLRQLGKEMKTQFQQAYETGFAAVTPKGVSKTSADLAQKAFAKRLAKKDKLITA